jgi:CRP-like cAMP-binding protein
MALSSLEKILFLKSVHLFDQIPSEQLVKVAQIAQEVEFGPGERFIKQGESGDCLYVIVEGEAEVTLAGAGVVSLMPAKSIIGEMSILSGQPRSADCRAKTHLFALKIRRQDFWLLMEEWPEIALGIIKVLVHNLEVINQKLQSQPVAA